ncbi:hypothetical protein F5B22DRAFT_204536 [Xylaria bambusicola]|uniref:uncharacterized protein n=1 Tax=Xylaria bambusicola TaxID=326684 RepID=UPI002007C658|nr:uncharacterized protein F5B22DRAFT_204536 [Xylaria bambusicola]KAI0515155.1 hypothetical protein F5B22DRAFT_204536 [Xylaria bambusicola]
MLPIANARLLLQAPSRILSRVPNAVLPRNAIATRNGPRAVPARLSLAAQRASFATKPPDNPFQEGIDPEEDRKIAQRKLTPHPESVTMDSSVRHIYEPSPPGKAAPAKSGLTDDLKLVQETFSLSKAPHEPYWLGIAGTLPYLGTSLSTVYLSWVLNTPWPAPSAFTNKLLISQETAHQLMATLEPIQLGYGAVIISFLGAVHWGMEYAAKTSDHARTRFRYGLGVMAPIVAWPTLFMPVEFALTSQFAAFVALYFADTRATVRGWAPVWYSTYRFALTAVVGVAIAISLIGRAKVGDASPRLTGLNEKFHEHRGEEDYTKKWQELEKGERKKVKQREEEEKKKKEEEERKKKEEEKQKKQKGQAEADKKDGEKSSGDKDKGKESDSEENRDQEKKGDEQQGGGQDKKSEEKKSEEKDSE